MNLNCIIIDDEPLARKGLKEYVQEIEFLKLLGDFDNPIKAVSLVNEQPVDLLFLDIQMPKITGIEFLKSLQNPPMVIFTTAYSQYAVESFELDVVDYLVKPISFDRFFKASVKAKNWLENKRKGATVHTPSDEAYFFVKAENKHVKILLDDILFVEALQNYVAIHTKDKKILAYVTLGGIEKQLPSEHFIKVHKSFIVSVQKIKAVEGNEILIEQHRIPISRNLKDDVMNKVVESKLLKR
ncbi:MAG: DNA-binding response regulator [Bacteroidetes bacterium]|nr:MAG: DNA-binding response regulator [Bacteroidota bacterium]